MPLLSIEHIASHTQLALWHITESVGELQSQLALSAAQLQAVSAYKSVTRQRETLAIYALLHAVTGTTQPALTHNAQGKPQWASHHISISHTAGYAALILSKEKEVAVDIEYTSDRVETIRHKFLRPDESADINAHLLLHWCAKETAFKYFSAQQLQYFQMRLLPFNFQTSGVVTVENLPMAQALTVHYRITPHYTLTYAY